MSVLEVGQTFQVQNQHGPHANKLDLSGSIVEVVGHAAYARAEGRKTQLVSSRDKVWQ